MIRIRQLRILVGDITRDDLIKSVSKKLKCRVKDIRDIKIVRRSVDARKKNEIFYSYIIDVNVKNEKYILKRVGNNDIFYVEDKEYFFEPTGKVKMPFRPIIVGMGPSGLICGYMLAKYGYRPIIIDRGEDVDTRVKDINEFWNSNKLNINSNVQFGEGGAGTFSDGKLITRIKDKDDYQSIVFEILIENGAPEEIRYDSNPHIGTDNLRKVVKNIRNKIIDMGGTVRFNTILTDIDVKDKSIVSITVNDNEKINCNVLILGIGNSARDTFRMLYNKEIKMESKPFAVGVRVIHNQELINYSQYGIKKHKILKSANYKLTCKIGNRGVYTFCMCPGGYVINASSEEGRLCVNGMSNYKRDSECANSAVVVTVDKNDYGDGVLDGIKFQEDLEESTYKVGVGNIPVSLFRDYENDSLSTSFGNVIPSIKGRYTFANINGILPSEINDCIIKAMYEFNKKIDGFSSWDTVIAGIETRTSSAVRIVRDELGESSIKGIYPIGEGSGYAGGITSSAIDGLKTFLVISSKYMN